MRFVQATQFLFSQQLLRYEKFNWITMRNGGSGNKFDGFFLPTRGASNEFLIKPPRNKTHLNTLFQSESNPSTAHPKSHTKCMTGFLGDGFILRLYQTGGGPTFSSKRTHEFIFNPSSCATAQSIRGFNIIITPRFDNNIIVIKAHNHDPLLIRSFRLIALCFPTTSLVRSYITGIILV